MGLQEWLSINTGGTTRMVVNKHWWSTTQVINHHRDQKNNCWSSLVGLQYCWCGATMNWVNYNSHHTLIWDCLKVITGGGFEGDTSILPFSLWRSNIQILTICHSNGRFWQNLKEPPRFHKCKHYFQLHW